MKIKETKYTVRHLARIIIETETPLALGSGEKDVITDALVARDVNGLPYIPGTSIAGVLRSMIGEDAAKDFFGYQEIGKDKGHGSEIIFTDAKIVNDSNVVIDGLREDISNDHFLKHFINLPIRQHVRITDKGVADKTGKFDEQVVYKGTRFCFEIEIVATDTDNDNLTTVLAQLQDQSFRIGGGTRSGFGAIKVVRVAQKTLDLKDNEQRQLYLDKSSNLADPNKWWKESDYKSEEYKGGLNGFKKYELTLKPMDFFLFGSGMGDDDVDSTPVRENIVKWDGGQGHFTQQTKQILIPATSVKGVISHRTAFYWNKIKDNFADKISNPKDYTGSANPAVLALFGGGEGEKQGQNTVNQKRGNVLISDVFAEQNYEPKIFDHVAIDRFTGGAVDGALFNEKADYAPKKEFTLTMLVKEEAIKETEVRKAFENALKDICAGLLPLGGATAKGHGMFTGTLKIDGTEINLDEITI